MQSENNLISAATEFMPFVWRMEDNRNQVDTIELCQKLIQKATENSRRLARICLHESNDSPLHVMLIALAPESSFPVHRHLHREEFLLHLTGSGRLQVQDSSSELVERFHFNRKKTFRVPSGTWHSMAAGRLGLSFMEIRLGPFVSDDTQYYDVEE